MSCAGQLHCILVHFNPHRLKVRTRLFLETAKRLESQGAVVWRVEAAFGERPFEVTNKWRKRHIQLRTDETVWNKEALINIAANRILRNPNIEYLAWIDADVQFVRPDWVSATITELEHHAVVQMFSNAIDLNPKFDFMGRSQGFVRLYTQGQRPGDFEKNKNRYPSHMHPGYCWAWRRSAWLGVGGMITTGVLGSADNHMACALVGKAEESVWSGMHPDYIKPILEWQERAERVVNRDIGFVEGLILHHFHGYKEHRGYKNRVDILKEHQFSPSTDLEFDFIGMPRLKNHKPEFKQAVNDYMRSRKEYDLTNALENNKKQGFIHKIWLTLMGESS